jgi:hypothetical protein
VPVEVLASSVVAHGGCRVCVAGGDLYVAEVDTCVEHGRHEGVSKHVGVHARQAYAGLLSEVAKPSRGAVPVHSGAAAVEQDGTARALADGPLDGPPHGRR